jgi:hypothetical protein
MAGKDFVYLLDHLAWYIVRHWEKPNVKNDWNSSSVWSG